MTPEQRKGVNLKLRNLSIACLYSEMLVFLQSIVGFETSRVYGFRGEIFVNERVKKIASTLHTRTPMHVPNKENLTLEFMMVIATELSMKGRKLDLSDFLADNNMPNDINYSFIIYKNATGLFSNLEVQLPVLTPAEKFELLFYDPRNQFSG